MNEEQTKDSTTDYIYDEAPASAEEINPEDPGSPEKQIALLTSQLDEMKDKYLRSLAEMDNMKKRLQRERENIVRYGTENLLRDFLRVYDAVEKSVHTAQELHAGDTHFISGLEMVEKLFLEALKRHNVEPIEAQGLAFDPNFHEAMLHVETDKVSIPGLVVDVFEKGFMLHDRVLRPARVTVSKAQQENITKED